jgi:hypothetical protein
MSVLKTWGMRCPVCEDDSCIDVTARIDVRLVHEGTEVGEARNNDHEWDKDSPASCDCGFSGTVKDFEVPQ